MGLFGALVAKLSRSKISDLDWDQARRELLASDIGPALTDHVIEAAKKIKGDDARAGLLSALSGLISSKPRGLDLQHGRGDRGRDGGGFRREAESRG